MRAGIRPSADTNLIHGVKTPRDFEIKFRKVPFHQMRHALRKLLPALGLAFYFAADPEAIYARYPVLSLFTGRSDGPYQPAPRRYTVVDPVPVAPTYPVGPHGHHAGAAAHAAEVAAQNPPLWRKHDAVTPVYPYGWFGARHANERQTRGSYYGDYSDAAIIRGR